MEEKDVVEADLDRVGLRLDQSNTDLGYQLERVVAAKDMEVDRGGGKSTLSTGTPESGSGPRPGIIAVRSPAVAARYLGNTTASGAPP